MAINPYRTAPGSDPPFLAGRDEELREAEDGILQVRDGAAPSPIIITGLRGMGKTVLLRRYERAAKAEGAIVIAAEATPRASLTSTLRAGLERARLEASPISTSLRKAVDSVLTALPEATYEFPGNLGSVKLKKSAAREHERLQAALDTLNREVRKHDRWLSIRVDEVQQADALTLDSLITCVHESAGTREPILFLGAGLHSAKPHLIGVRTYTERWHYQEIGLLPLAATIDAIQEPARANGHVFTQEALDYVAEASVGYPFFVQEFGSIAWSRRDLKRKTITLKDVEASVPQVRRKLEKQFYSDPLNRLTPRELAYALEMASLGEGARTVSEVANKLGLTTSSVSSTRQQLIKKDIIYVPDKGLVEFRVPLMSDYIKAHFDELSSVVRRRHEKRLGEDK